MQQSLKYQEYNCVLSVSSWPFFIDHEGQNAGTENTKIDNSKARN